MADMWSFDFSKKWAWTPIRAHGDLPMPAREGHSVVHAHTQVVWIFGGLDGAFEYRNDMWELDTNSSRLGPFMHLCKTCASPAPRALHAAASDGDGTMWVFGGERWSDVSAGGQASADSRGAGLVYLNDLWRVRCRPEGGECKPQGEEGRQSLAPFDVGDPWLNIKSFHPWLELGALMDVEKGGNARPVGRSGASLAYHVGSGGTKRLLLFGGYDGGQYLNDLWQWVMPPVGDAPVYGELSFADAIGWWKPLLPAGPTPSARDFALGLAAPTGSNLFVTLGHAGSTFAQSDAKTVWSYDPNVGWSSITPGNDGPYAREQMCHGIHHSPQGDRLFAFGGRAHPWLPTGPRGGPAEAHVWTDELWIFDNTCVKPSVSRPYPARQDGACPSPPNQYTQCTYGAASAAPGTAPCVGLTDYSFPQNAWARSERSATWASEAEAEVPRRPDLPINDFTSWNYVVEKNRRWEPQPSRERAKYPSANPSAAAGLLPKLPHPRAILPEPWGALAADDTKR